MWSFGVIMYTMLCGFPPFYSEDDEILLELIAEAKFAFPNPWWEDVSQSAKELISHLLEKDPTKRYTAEQFLSHPWIQGKSLRDSGECPHRQDQLKKDKQSFKKSLNKSIDVQRDGFTTLRSASESTLWKRRQDKKQFQNSDPTVENKEQKEEETPDFTIVTDFDMDNLNDISTKELSGFNFHHNT